MVRLTIKQCAYFLAVAEYGGIAQASRALNISQPAVAQAIDKLELNFGFKLFDRHHARGTELTIQGRSFAIKADLLVKRAELTEQAAYGIAANKVGVIRLGCFHTIAPFHLPQIISNYKKLYPSVEIKPMELQQDEILEYLDADKIDLAITYDMSIFSKGLKKRVLAELPTYLLINRDHTMAEKESIELQDMVEEPFIMFEGASSQEFYAGVLASQGIEPKIAYRATSMQSVRSAVSSNLGYSLAVMVSKHDILTSGSLVKAIPIKGSIKPLSVVMLGKNRIENSRQLEQLSLYCEEHFREN